jgi:NitT/TauT family transport system substrate-binding protein
MKMIRIAVPDLVSNSYFPALAAIELGCFRDEGLDGRLDHIFPSPKAFAALREGTVDLIAAPAHALLSAFPEWQGVKLLAALAQGTYWLLVLNADLKAIPGDVNAIKGRRIGAAPMVDLALRQLCIDSGLDLARDKVEIVPVPGAYEPGVSFGIAAAKAQDEGSIDGFWANGLGAEYAVRSGKGDIILDVRRGLGPSVAFHYTFPAVAASDRFIATEPDLVERAMRAIVRAQRMLRADVSLANLVGGKLFPAAEAEYVEAVVKRDLAYYSAEISLETVDGIIRFSQACGLLERTPSREDIVAMPYSHLWGEAGL